MIWSAFRKVFFPLAMTQALQGWEMAAKVEFMGPHVISVESYLLPMALIALKVISEKFWLNKEDKL